MFTAGPRSLPSYLMSGFGQDTTDTTITDWITTIFQPIADVAVKYYDLQAGQYTPQAQRIVQATTFPSLTSINPIYLIGGGLLVWYLWSGTHLKGKKSK